MTVVVWLLMVQYLKKFIFGSYITIQSGTWCTRTIDLSNHFLGQEDSRSSESKVLFQELFFFFPQKKISMKKRLDFDTFGVHRLVIVYRFVWGNRISAALTYTELWQLDEIQPLFIGFGSAEPPWNELFLPMKLGRTCPKRLTIVFQSSIFRWRSVSSRESNCWILDINNCWWTWYPLLLQKWTEILWRAMRRWIRKGFLGGEEGTGGLLSRCWGEKWPSCDEGINIQQSRIQFLSKKSNYQSWEQTCTKQTNQGGGLPKGIQGLSQVYEIFLFNWKPTSETLQRKLHV